MSSFKISAEIQSQLMAAALHEAQQAFDRDEVPVGAVVARIWNGSLEIVAQAGNMVEQMQSAAAHAEFVAIQAASKRLGSWRLQECVLAVTLEPCTMCAGLIRLSRIPTIIYGAGDSRQGAFGSLYDLSQDTRLGSVPRVIAGQEERACSELLTKFFAKKRTRTKQI